MPEPHVNVFVCLGKMLADGVMDYIGPNNAVPRCRFTLVQARPHKLERATRGYETIVNPCEIFGRFAETFCSLCGQDSWVSVQGRTRSYFQKMKHPEIWFVIERFSVIEAIRPGRGYGKRTEDPRPCAVEGLPNIQDEDET